MNVQILCWAGAHSVEVQFLLQRFILNAEIICIYTAMNTEFLKIVFQSQ